MGMNQIEVSDFLTQADPPLLGVVGTIDAAQYPTSIPVWFRYDGDTINIWTTMARAWPKHLQRHPKISFAAMETQPPFAAVLIKGKAELVVEGPDHWAEVRRITERYIAPDEVDAYIEPWAVLETMCVIHPEKVISWKRGY
jgi:nitroimidazol reductase NimA-like FMN-containing flavoprotein (pyridoxamine 5'-phosphate oxidase superfamily)